MKYKHLYCWDRMMHSTYSWSEMVQEYAEHDDAPLDAIYYKKDGITQKRIWHRYVDIENERTKERIDNLMKEYFGEQVR
jgi:hypothetical protein